jgi:SAM-dependent methyltransferase
VIRRLRDAIRDRVLPAAASPADQWQRVELNRAMGELIASLDPPICTAAEISGQAYVDTPWKRHVSLSHPDFDVCAPLGDHETFDVVICEQVLEHVVDPCGAAANLRRLCTDDGHVIVSTPFLIKVHELPIYAMRDYWRFTPRGLQTLLENAGLEVESVAAWGNRECIVGNLSRWSAYRRWHSLRDEPDLPVQVWAFARNRGQRSAG